MKLKILTFAVALTLATNLFAQTFTTLHSFTGSDGANPVSSLILSGNTLYGTTKSGGKFGNGALFKVNIDGTGFTNLYSFTASTNPPPYVYNSDGANPYAELTLSGNTLFGTASGGGSSGDGVIFKINTDGTGFTALHSFNFSDGAGPQSGLILSGNALYGTASGGGSSSDGAVFKINTDGTSFTLLDSFVPNPSDGANSVPSLILSGNTLYGTTANGGMNVSGTVFAVNTDSSGFTILCSSNINDGRGLVWPIPGLILSSNTLYGTAISGGSLGYGILFEINTNGTGFTTLHNFANSDGAGPRGRLILSSNTLYGTASGGGSFGNGTVFAINANGTSYKILHSFTTLSPPISQNGTNGDGSEPVAGLILFGNTLYGTTEYGGSSSNGTVFALSLGPSAPIIIAQPQSQTVQVGSNVTINVAAYGSLPLSYQWFFNSSKVPGQTNTTFQINTVQLTNGGNYSVTITNAYGSTNSAIAQLTVYTNLVLVQTNRTPTSSEISIVFLPSQLEVFQNGSFASALAVVDTNTMTIVLTHGWIPTLPVFGPVFTPNGVEDWPMIMAAELHAQVPNVNIMAWNWESAAQSPLSNPKQAGSQTPQQGIQLGQALQAVLGSNYSKPVHFIGHSFGTLVNAYAANYLQGSNFGIQGTNFASEPVSTTPWPATNMQMTLFDEAEVGASVDFTLNSQDLADLANANANLLTASPYYHPLPNRFAWADNYVSAVGLLQSAAANVILTNGFPASAPDPYHWFLELGSFHGYPMSWYEETIETDVSKMGFLWSFERGGSFSQAPSVGSVYLQSGSEWNLTPTNWNYGTNLVAARFQEYRGGVINSISNQVPGLVTVNGSVNGQIVVNEQIDGALAGADAFLLSFFTSANNSTPHFEAHPQGLSPNDVTNNVNVPAYAWMQLVVPTNATSMSFNYVIQGNWQSDSLAAAFNGTNVLLLAGSAIETNVLFNSGSIDVSAFVGQTNEFFIGIVGGTSTNAQLTVDNFAFSISLPPSLQAQVGGANLIFSWPMSAQSFGLQTTTNLANPSSWTTLTNVPAIVNLQNTITNPVSGSQGFYRLIQSQ
jgi:uncharacterized repeat protein (TIGR03803 family)